jgi:Autographiviridae endonuclease VII
MSKICPNCKLEKNLSKFSRDKYKKDGRCSWCKECIKNADNGAARKVRSDKFYQDNKERLLLWQKERNVSNTEFRRSNRLLKYYGITISDYNKIFDEQSGCCAICVKHQSEFKKILCVDHNHQTGKVRGLLCHKCNTALGLFQDNPEILELAAEYSKR